MKLLSQTPRKRFGRRLVDDLAEWLFCYPTRRVRTLDALRVRAQRFHLRERRWCEDLERAERAADNARRASALAVDHYREACRTLDARFKAEAEAEAECRRLRARAARRTAP